MRAKRWLGQNFLTDRHYQQRIISALAPSAGETIIEIGPGRGALTRWLLETGARLIAIEVDRDLIPEISATFDGNSSLELICADALEVNYCGLVLPAASARVVANLPYNTSTPILQRLIESRCCISEMVLMLQREVVDRMRAVPGGKEYGYLTVLVQYYCELERLFDVPPGAFRPSPKVYSSVVRLRTRARPVVTVGDEKLFFELTQVLFSQRRKTISNNLRAGAHRLGLVDLERNALRLKSCGIDLNRRGETLDLAEIANLTDCLAEMKNATLRKPGT